MQRQGATIQKPFVRAAAAAAAAGAAVPTKHVDPEVVRAASEDAALTEDPVAQVAALQAQLAELKKQHEEVAEAQKLAGCTSWIATTCFIDRKTRHCVKCGRHISEIQYCESQDNPHRFDNIKQIAARSKNRD
jgi:hypothetical protein